MRGGDWGREGFEEGVGRGIWGPWGDYGIGEGGDYGWRRGGGVRRLGG